MEQPIPMRGRMTEQPGQLLRQPAWLLQFLRRLSQTRQTNTADIYERLIDNMISKQSSVISNIHTS